MTENKNAATSAMQKLARQIQQALSQYGDSIAMGSVPTIVVFQANTNPANPDDVRMWHAGIIYRQHVAASPERALASLGHTIFETAARLDVQAPQGAEGVEPVKELPGGGTILPDVWE